MIILDLVSFGDPLSISKKRRLRQNTNLFVVLYSICFTCARCFADALGGRVGRSF